jgi:hypothetical protein
MIELLKNRFGLACVTLICIVALISGNAPVALFLLIGYGVYKLITLSGDNKAP